MAGRGVRECANYDRGLLPKRPTINRAERLGQRLANGLVATYARHRTVWSRDTRSPAIVLVIVLTASLKWLPGSMEHNAATCN